MIPQLTPDGCAAGPAIGAPPLHFRPLEDAIEDVKWSPHRNYGTPRGKTAAQDNGIRYEEKVQARLKHTLGPRYFRNPCLEVTCTGWKVRILVPDGIFFHYNGTAYVFEIKSQHMPEAWWQLRKLYEPAVQHISFVNWVSCIEVCRSYDPAMGFPEKVERYDKVLDAVAAPLKPLKVVEWRL